MSKIRSKISRNFLRVGSLNVRGINKENERNNLADDFHKYHLDLLGVQECKLIGSEVVEITTNDAKKQYDLYFVGNNKNHGVGIVAKKELKAEFRTITNRICEAIVKIGENRSERKLHFFSVYAPTLEQSEKQTDLRENFYDSLQDRLREIKNRDLVVIAGDFNAKTGSGYSQFSDAIGRYGKGELNSNGTWLLDFAMQNELYLTNTHFKHKMCHRTTWTAPEKKKAVKHQDGTIRRNPYRNQIDYIVIKKESLKFVKNSRSYGGISVNTDHKLVKTEIEFEWWKMPKRKGKRKERINIESLQHPVVQEVYQKELWSKIDELDVEEQDVCPQMKWNQITKVLKETAKNVLGTKHPLRRYQSKKVQELSEKQKKIRNDIEATRSKQKRNKLKKERNSLLHQIQKELQKEETNKLNEKIQEIESFKEDSNRMYQVMKQLQSQNKQKIQVQSEDGITVHQQTQVQIVSKYFETVFKQRNNNRRDKNLPTSAMKIPFTEKEVTEAVFRLKNNKSCGIDDIHAELIKFAPTEVHHQIAEIYNEIAKTGQVPEEITDGILVPLQKPGKKKGPPSNLRPVILLTTLRKILAIIMIKRIQDKLETKIPLSQAAYRAGRNTTEHVFACKILAEKAVISKNYQVTLLLLDMSKAFDRVNREDLLDQLEKILEEDELNILKILITDVRLQVRIGNELGEKIVTDIGVPQGDCLSPILFTLYLANAMTERRTILEEEHNYNKHHQDASNTIPKILQEHSYSKTKQGGFFMDQQYADDVGWIEVNGKDKTAKVKKLIPDQLKQKNLQINEEKTEEYTISRNEDKSWKKCKYLGSMLDTEEDIKRRKGLAMMTYNKMKNVIEHKKTSKKTKQRIMQAYIESIFLYNSELWTLNKQSEKDINIFQRKIIRRMYNIKWFDKVSNEELYKRYSMKPWNEKIQERRLRWYGHLLRLNEDVPARKALVEAEKEVRKPMGGQKLTWLKLIEKDLQDKGIKKEGVGDLAQDRLMWREMISCRKPTSVSGICS